MRISKRIACKAIMIRSSPSCADPSDYIQEIVVIASGVVSRSVRVTYDDGWRFFSSGLPLQNEDLSRYGRRAVKARLDRKYLLGLFDSMAGRRSEGDPPFFHCHWDRLAHGH
jgi:hypothetical protein